MDDLYFQQFTLFIFGQKMFKHGPEMAKMAIISKMVLIFYKNTTVFLNGSRASTCFGIFLF